MKIERRLGWTFARSHPLDAARILEGLTDAQRVDVLDTLPDDLAAPVLQFMEASLAAASLSAWSPARTAAVLGSMPPENAARLLERCSAERRGEILAQLPRQNAATLQRLMRRAADTAGAWMSPKFVALAGDLTVGEARKQVQQRPQGLLFYIYVVDRDDRLVGVLNLRELMMASPKSSLASVMRTDVQTLPVHATRKSIVTHPGWSRFHALPVVDRDGVLVGVIRYKTLRQLEADPATLGRSSDLLPVGLALGELYWSAASALLDGVLDTIATAQSDSSRSERHGA